MKRANLADKKASDCPNKAADCVAQFKFGGLGESFAIGDGDDCDIAEELDGLEDVQAVSTDVAVEAESDVAVRFTRELVRINA